MGKKRGAQGRQTFSGPIHTISLCCILSPIHAISLCYFGFLDTAVLVFSFLVGCITGMGAAYGKVKTEKWHTCSIEGSDKARTVMKSILPVFVTGVLVSLLVCRGGIGDAEPMPNSQNLGMILILIFAEAPALYVLTVGIILSS